MKLSNSNKVVIVRSLINEIQAIDADQRWKIVWKPEASDAFWTTKFKELEDQWEQKISKRDRVNIKLMAYLGIN
jgi:hypothetical protein